jgi:uncharacterized protein YbjT (DUF2867 family)
MRVLVTGGTGVVGSGTVTELLARAQQVVLLARHAVDDVRQWPKGVTPWPGDVTDAASVRGAADGCDAVVHLAGIVEESGEATFDAVNVRGTANVIAEAERAGVKRFVFVSSLGAPQGSSAYHRSKMDAERLVRRFRGDWVICRPGNVYGPGDEQISLLLRLVRGPSSIVPRVGDGEQQFQPLWWEDCAAAIASAAERTELSARELEIAGTEVTCQNDLMRRLSHITGRDVVGVGIPEFLASAGAKAVSLVGWDMSFNEQQVTMLREGNVIAPNNENALETVLGVTPTPLDDGLRRLADLQPEQLPVEGVGALKRKRYWADIVGSRHDAVKLFELFRRSFNDVTPVFVDAAAEPRTNGLLSEGESVTLSLPMRGHVQVRVADLGDRHATLLTLEGHPLAGAVSFRCEPRGTSVRFEVEVYDRAANLLDLLAMRTLGDRLQNRTWSEVVNRMIERSGGRAPDGVQRQSATLGEREAKAVEERLEELVMKRKREENAEAMGISA